MLKSESSAGDEKLWWNRQFAVTRGERVPGQRPGNTECSFPELRTCPWQAPGVVSAERSRPRDGTRLTGVRASLMYIGDCPLCAMYIRKPSLNWILYNWWNGSGLGSRRVCHLTSTDQRDVYSHLLLIPTKFGRHWSTPSWVVFRTDRQTDRQTYIHGWSQYLLRLYTEARR